MPLYEYKCPHCGRFEVIQKFSDAPLSVCPTCGREVQKLLSAPAIQFKGSGWYVTDYARKSSGGDAAKAEGGKASEGDKTAKGESGTSDATASKDGSASGSKDSAPSTKSGSSTAK